MTHTSMLLGFLMGFFAFIGLIQTYNDYKEHSCFCNEMNGWIIYPVVNWIHVMCSGLFIFYLYSTY